MKLQLRDYQKEGVFRLMKGSCMLAWDMGLGKTIAAIVAMRALEPDRVLIVCPKSMIRTWREELDKWWSRRADCTIVVTNYESLPDLKSRWDILILDEAHKVKNRPQQRKGKWYPIRSRNCAMIAKNSKVVWCLTGTPIMNRADEIWHPLHLIDRKEFSSYWKFAQTWCATTFSRWARTGIEILPGVAPGKAPEFAAYLDRWVLKRSKEDVRLELPKVTKQIHLLDMTDEQADLHHDLLHNLKVEVDNGKVITVRNVLSRTMFARRCAVSPSLVGGSDLGAKLPALFDLMEDLENERIVIFSQWADPLKLVKAYTNALTHTLFCLHGALSEKARHEQIESWRACSTGCLLATIGTGGVGLTLTEAHTAIFLDEPWNPAEMAQAIGRLDRIGQTMPVNIHILRCANSIEDVVADAIGQKQRMVDLINAELSKLN